CTSGTLPLELTATSAGPAVVSNWAWVFPNGSTVQGQNQTIFNPTLANAGTYTVVATSSLGCTGSASEVVSVNPPPTAPVLFGSATATCVGAQENIFTNQAYSGSVTYVWSAMPMAGSGLTPVNNPIVSVTPTVPGTYIYSLYVVVDGCISDTAEWSLTVDAFPVIDLDVVGDVACVDGGSDLTLVDNGTGATSWMWSGPFGTLPGNTSSVVLQDVNDSFTGLYTVIAKSVNGCETTATTFLNITMGLSPDAQLAASESTICEGGFVELTGTFYTGASYIWTGNGVPANSQSMNAITVFPVGTGTFTYQFAATDGACTTDVVSVTITVEAQPVVDIVVSGELNCVDGTSPVTLSTTAAGIANFVWTGPDGTTLSNAASLAIANASSVNSGTYFLDVVAAGSGCTGFGSVDVVITDGLDGLVASNTLDGCEDGILSLSASSFTGPTTYQWYSPSNLQVPFSMMQNPSIASGAVSGTYYVVASNGGCTDTATVVVEILGAISANDGDVKGFVDVPQEFNMSDFVNFNYADYTINILQQPLNGTVEQASDSIYVFRPDAGFWGTDNLIVEFCYVNCPGLCDIAKITLITNYSDDECVITTVISPNDDGANDEMVVSCAETSLSNTLVVYNQWGDKVYEAAPYLNDWKGTYEGQPLPDGTYFFVFQQDSDTAPKKGFVMIYR
ncbi:MAG: gliding motility-associated C-terminal domain-containing protein, partial [Saprospiraceae bacterium]|nr:gliding motility-associated C-terminal domain-containing protein [Saprospiraceae bacterium]